MFTFFRTEHVHLQTCCDSQICHKEVYCVQKKSLKENMLCDNAFFCEEVCSMLFFFFFFFYSFLFKIFLTNKYIELEEHIYAQVHSVIFKLYTLINCCKQIRFVMQRSMQ